MNIIPTLPLLPPPSEKGTIRAVGKRAYVWGMSKAAARKQAKGLELVMCSTDALAQWLHIRDMRVLPTVTPPPPAPTPAAKPKRKKKAAPDKQSQIEFVAPIWKPIPGAVQVRGWGRGTITGQLEVKDTNGNVTHVWHIVERIGGGMRRGFKSEDIIKEIV